MIERVAALPKARERRWIRFFLKKVQKCILRSRHCQKFHDAICKALLTAGRMSTGRFRCLDFDSPQEIYFTAFHSRNWKLGSVWVDQAGSWSIMQKLTNLWATFDKMVSRKNALQVESCLICPCKVHSNVMRRSCEFTVIHLSGDCHPLRFLGSIIQGGHCTTNYS